MVYPLLYFISFKRFANPNAKQKLTGAKCVRVNTVIDESLVAGFTIKYSNGGSKLINMSVKPRPVVKAKSKAAAKPKAAAAKAKPKPKTPTKAAKVARTSMRSTPGKKVPASLKPTLKKAAVKKTAIKSLKPKAAIAKKPTTATKKGKK